MAVAKDRKRRDSKLYCPNTSLELRKCRGYAKAIERVTHGKLYKAPDFGEFASSSE
jgi:hypothetical protein